MEEKNASRINIEDLPQAEQELTVEDARKVQGGAITTINTDTDSTRERRKETIEISSFGWG